MGNQNKCESIINSLTVMNFSNEGMNNDRVSSLLDSLQRMTRRLSLYNYDNVQAKKQVSTRVANDKIIYMQEKLNEINANADLRNKCLYPLRKLIEEINAHDVIPAIVTSEMRFEEIYEQHYEEICQMIDALENNLKLYEVLPEELVYFEDDQSSFEEIFDQDPFIDDETKSDYESIPWEKVFDSLLEYRNNKDMWFKLSRWGRITEKLTPHERNFIYAVGRYVQQKWQLSSRQENWALNILKSACRHDFNYCPY
jgi:hypothetical protein